MFLTPRKFQLGLNFGEDEEDVLGDPLPVDQRPTAEELMDRAKERSRYEMDGAHKKVRVKIASVRRSTKTGLRNDNENHDQVSPQQTPQDGVVNPNKRKQTRDRQTCDEGGKEKIRKNSGGDTPRSQGIRMRAAQKEEEETKYDPVQEADAECEMHPDSIMKWQTLVRAARFEEVQLSVDGQLLPLRDIQRQELSRWLTGTGWDTNWLVIRNGVPYSFIARNGTEMKLHLLGDIETHGNAAQPAELSTHNSDKKKKDKKKKDKKKKDKKKKDKKKEDDKKKKKVKTKNPVFI